MSRAVDLRTLAVSALAGLLALGCGDSPTEPHALSLTLSEQAVTIAQAASRTVTVRVQRTNFGGSVGLTVSGAPNGVTAAFTPASLAPGSESSTLQITVAADAAPGPTTLLVKASGDGVPERTAALALTIEVAGNFALATLEAALRVAQGGGGSATVLVNRADGFTGTVSISVSGAPAGVTATVAPAAASSDAVSLQLTAAANAAPGDYPLTITGTSPGRSARTTSLTLAVIPPPGTASMTLGFCPGSVPIWLAYQNEGYLWRQATRSGTAFTFAGTEKVGIALAYQAGAAVEVQVRYATRAEQEAVALTGLCRGDKSLTGSVAGLADDQLAAVGMGIVGSLASAAAPQFSLTGVPERPIDLVAARTIPAGASGLSPDIFVPDALIIRRSLNLTSGATIPALDFASAEAFAPATTALSIVGIRQDERVDVSTALWTATSTFSPVFWRIGSFSPVLYSVPASQLASGDLHELWVDISSSSYLRRSYVAYFAGAADRTDVPGPYVVVPEVTRLTGSPHLRMRARVAPQPEYGGSVRVIFGGLLGAIRNVSVLVTAAYLGGTPSSWDIAVPDLAMAPGFQTSWMPTADQAPWVQLNAYSTLFRVPSHPGDLVRFATRLLPVGAGASADARVTLAARRLMIDDRGTGAPAGFR